MQVNLYATFRLLAGEKSFQIDLPEGATVHQLVMAVVERLPVLRPHWLSETGEVHAHVHIFINGEDVQNLPLRAKTPLPTSAVVDFLPPVGGG